MTLLLQPHNWRKRTHVGPSDRASGQEEEKERVDVWKQSSWHVWNTAQLAAGTNNSQ